MRKFEGNTTVSCCIDGTSILQDTVINFDRKCKEVLDNNESQAHSVATDPMLYGTNFYFSLKDLDVAIDRLNTGTGFDRVHTSHIKSSKRCYRKNYVNSIISLSHILIFHIVCLQDTYVQP